MSEFVQVIDVMQVATAEPATLAELAKQINTAHALAEEGVRTGAERARRVGELLVRAKRLCGHGNWLPWLNEHAQFSRDRAAKYMRIARRWDELRANVAGTRHLTIEEGLRILGGGEDEDEPGDEDAGPLTQEEFDRRLKEEEEEAINQHRRDQEIAYADLAAWVAKVVRRGKKKIASVHDGDTAPLLAWLADGEKLLGREPS